MNPEEEGSWAEDELGGAELGDVRRTKRLVALAKRLAARPETTLPQALSEPAMLKAGYRFFDNDEIRAEQIVAAHVRSTLGRIAGERIVLAVQDTSLLDFTSHGATSGLGPLAQEHRQGLLLHSTMSFTEDGVPLGLLGQQVWARDPAEFGKAANRRERPIEEKESFKWLEGLKASNQAAEACPGVQVVNVADREADVYDLFLYDRPPNSHLLIRASWNRCVEHEEAYLRAAVASQPVAANRTIEVPRQGKRRARSAEVELRYASITLRPPGSRAKERLPSVMVNVVAITEPFPPDTEPGLDWLLITTLPISSVDQAMRAVAYYKLRWQIEVWHRVLKSGCKIERLQLETAERLTRGLALFSVVAWRLLFATMLSRSVGDDIPCSVVFEEDEWQALFCLANKSPIPPAEPPPLSQAVRALAKLGGFLGRKGDGEPGPTTLWRGLQQLNGATELFRTMKPFLTSG